MGCRKVAAQGALVRVVRADDGTLTLSRTAPGRGAWLCASSPACVALAVKRRAFARAFREPVAEGAADGLSASPPATSGGSW